MLAKEKGKRAFLAVRPGQETVLNWERLQRTNVVETQFREGGKVSDRESGQSQLCETQVASVLGFLLLPEATTDLVASNNEDSCEDLGPSRIIKLAQDISHNHVFHVPFLKTCVYPKKNGKWSNSLSRRSHDQTCSSVSLLYPA